MRMPILILAAMVAFVSASAFAAGDHAELYNIGVTVSSEDEQTRITLYIDTDMQPTRLDTDEENILIFDLPDVELTAVDEGVTSVTVFSPSVASIKLTQIGTEPYMIRFEIYTNGPKECKIERTEIGYDFIVFAPGDTPVLTEPVEAEPIVEEPVEEPPVEEIIEEPPVEIPEEVIEEEPEEVIEEPEEEPAPVEEEPAEEEEEAGGVNLLEGVNLLQEETPSEPIKPIEEEEVWVAPAEFIKLESLNYQVGDADTDLLVFTLADYYDGKVRTNFKYKKGFIVLGHCDVSDFVATGDFKTVALSGMHLRYVVININADDEGVFSLILQDPEADYDMEYEINENVVRVFLKLAE